ncbi:MAG: ANTAR domain-containing protein [Acidimicrobiales bacterium]
MDPESRLRIVTALSTVADDEVDPSLCGTCAALLGMRGAAITVMTAADHRGVLCSSNATAAALEDLQATLGEGPGIDAHRRGVPVGEPDLANPRRSKWLAFCGPAVAAGAAAVFAFPLRVGGVRLGVLTLNHDRRGVLSGAQHADALVVVDVVTHAVLAIQADAPPGMVAGALAAVVDDRVEVHQAAGMAAVRLGVSVGEAFVRLRALAYAEERPLADVARDVIARRVRLS